MPKDRYGAPVRGPAHPLDSSASTAGWRTTLPKQLIKFNNKNG